jgi:hypothetical protein
MSPDDEDMKRKLYLTLGAVALLPACMILDVTQLSNEPVDFVSEVKPILESRCLECHHSRYVFAGLNLETKAPGDERRAQRAGDRARSAAQEPAAPSAAAGT